MTAEPKPSPLSAQLASAADSLEREFRSSKVFRQIKRIALLIIGGTVLLIGVALLVLPGPAFIVIPAGLSILAVEFAWARRWLRRARDLWRQASGR